MKHIDLIIPTRNRWEKLQRCLKSISFKTLDIILDVIIICDDDYTTAYKLISSNENLITQIIYVKKHSGSVYCRNLVTQTVEDALIYATDDIEFKEGAIDAAIKAMHEHFPDEDGVIGFNQVNARFSHAGVGLVGQKFLQRYPNRKLFYPEYFHFSCQEIERLGNKIGKLHLAEAACIHHYHPSKNANDRDMTHVEARKYRAMDKILSSQRRAKKLIWGDHE